MSLFLFLFSLFKEGNDSANWGMWVGPTWQGEKVFVHTKTHLAFPSFNRFPSPLSTSFSMKKTGFFLIYPAFFDLLFY
jgi:hypothetical protein